MLRTLLPLLCFAGLAEAKYRNIPTQTVALPRWLRVPGTYSGTLPAADLPFQAPAAQLVFTDTQVLIDLQGQAISGDARCSQGPKTTAGVVTANSCGFHVHAASTCDVLGSANPHYYQTPVDPWINVVYTPGSTANIGPVEYGATFMDTVGRVVILHDYDGFRIGCAPITSAGARGDGVPTVISGKAQPAYPTYASSAENQTPPAVTPAVSASEIKVTAFPDNQVQLEWVNLFADPRCANGVSGAANSCGIHLHAGTSCLSHDDVKGHFWNAALTDPWIPISYTSYPSTGNSGLLNLGQTWDNYRALVVHDFNGVRISCSLVYPNRPGTLVLAQPLRKIPGYLGDIVPSATDIKLDFFAPNMVNVGYSGLVADPACESLGADPTATNSCGLHLHVGTSCSNSLGHYWATGADPWLTATYNGSEGDLAVNYGFPIHTGTGYAFGRTVVVHDRAGKKIGCAPLTLPMTTATVQGSWLPYPEPVTVGYAGPVSMFGALQVQADSVTWTYSNLVADPSCTSASGSANSCGLHLHKGNCPTGLALGHFTNLSPDPWNFAPYTTNTFTGSLTVKFGTAWAVDEAVSLVVHNRDSKRIACLPLNPRGTCTPSTTLGYSVTEYDLDLLNFAATATCNSDYFGQAMVTRCAQSGPYSLSGCTALTQCSSAEFESAAATSTSDRVCTPLTACTSAEFESAAATSTSDRVCTPLTECTSAEFETTAATSTSDRVCTPLTACTSAQFETTAATSTSDRVCTPLTVCTSAQFESTPATWSSDRVCTPLTTCTRTQYQSKAATSTSNRVCNPLTVCTSAQFQSKRPTWSSDRICSPKIILTRAPTRAPTRKDSSRERSATATKSRP